MSVLSKSAANKDGPPKRMKALDLPTEILVEVAQGFPDAPNLQKAIELELAKRRDQREEERHDEALDVARGANHIAKWAIVLAVLALIVAIIQTFWHL